MKRQRGRRTQREQSEERNEESIKGRRGEEIKAEESVGVEPCGASK